MCPAQAGRWAGTEEVAPLLLLPSPSPSLLAGLQQESKSASQTSWGAKVSNKMVMMGNSIGPDH